MVKLLVPYAFCLMVLLLGNSLVQAQTFYDIPINVSKYRYNYRDLNYEIVKAVDQRDDKSGLGKSYGGIVKSEYWMRVKGGVNKSFTKFLQRASYNGRKDSIQILASIKTLSLNIPSRQDYKPIGPDRMQYAIEVDYYKIKGDNFEYVFTDGWSVDTVIRSSKFPFVKFTRLFFETSLLKLNDALKIPEKNQNRIEEPKPSDSLNSEISDITSKQLPENLLKSINDLPEEFIRPKIHHLFSYEEFNGNNANGLRIRYMNYARSWDDFNWVPLASFDIEAMQLNEDPFPNSNLNVNYAYFALGAGALKPFNNFVYLDLGLKLGYGQEAVTGFFAVEQEENGFFGLFFTQRIHFILGKGLGLNLSLGTYENVLLGSKYLKNDIGFMLGGGLKF